MSLRTKLLIFEFKERYPSLMASDISELFNLNALSVLNLFNEGEIIVPSKMNDE
jgi:hypothetical protein